MSFKSDQYKNAVKFKKSLQDDEENGYIVTYKGKQYEHFFKKTYLNLWENIRKDALNYFLLKGINWHTNNIENNPKTIPEGDMLSSQIIPLINDQDLTDFLNYLKIRYLENMYKGSDAQFG
jgi:hypothetical protein